MKIAILETGRPPDTLAKKHGFYPDMVRIWLSADQQDFTFESFSMLEEPLFPDINSFDGFVITGSKYSVQDDTRWMKKLKKLILDAGNIEKPVFGICFGHQIMASAYGAKIEKAQKGWALGVQTYRCDQMSQIEEIPVFVFHQDQVTTVPETAIPRGGNDFCPIGMLDYGKKGFSVQYHPEFSADYLLDLLDFYEKTLSPKAVSEAKISVGAHNIPGHHTAHLVKKLFNTRNQAMPGQK